METNTATTEALEAEGCCDLAAHIVNAEDYYEARYGHKAVTVAQEAEVVELALAESAACEMTHGWFD